MRTQRADALVEVCDDAGAGEAHGPLVRALALLDVRLRTPPVSSGCCLPACHEEDPERTETKVTFIAVCEELCTLLFLRAQASAKQPVC